MKRVVVWKRDLLPASETFIRNQADALTRYDPVFLGTGRVGGPLDRTTDVIVPPPGPPARLRARMYTATGRSGRVRRELRALHPDLVHAHFAGEALAIWRACRAEGVPFVVTLHGHDVTAAPRLPGVTGWRYRRRVRRMFRHASAVIAVSDFIAARALDLGAPPDRLSVHHIGVPIGDPSPPARWEHRRWDVAFVGRLVEKKGVADLLTAVARVQSAPGAIRVAVVGDGPLRVRLERLAHECGVDVDFLGMRSADEVRGVLSLSRVFCGPSRTAPSGDAEGFGLVFAEAALAGLAVVAYRHGGVVDAVEHGVTGILVPEGDFARLGEALSFLLTDPARSEQAGAAGRDRVVERFDVVRQTRLLEEIYDRVVHPAEAAHSAGRRGPGGAHETVDA